MGIVIALSGSAPAAVGALMALEERDIAPALTIARGGGALAAGLYACGWRAGELARLAQALERNRLALLGQLLPALSERATALSPRELSALALGDAPSDGGPPCPAAPGDALEALLGELTRGVELRALRMPLALPVRAYRRGVDGYLPEPEPRLLATGSGARYAVSLATALRCAAFAPELAGAPRVRDALLTQWPDARGELAAWRQLGGGAPLISIGPADEGDAPAQHGMRIALPAPGRRDGVRERMRTGHAAVRAHIDELLSFC